MNRRVLCVWLPNWSVQRVHAAEPALAGRAVVLETRDARRGLLIAAANLAARRAGAHVGMRMSELAALTTGPAAAVASATSASPPRASSPRTSSPAARASAPSSREEPVDSPLLWEIRPYQPEEDLDALCELAEQAQQFSPLVGLELHDAVPWSGRTHCQPQALLLDISGIPHLFGGEEALLAEVAQWLRQHRYFAYMSIASTVGAAWALANYEILRRLKGERSEGDPQSAGSNTLDLAPKGPQPAYEVPDCRTLITESWEEAEMLSELSVSALRIDDETVGKLRRLGVKTLCQLWQLPRDGLASRLGAELLKRSDQALGVLDEPIIALHSSPDWTLEFPLETATRSEVALAEVLRRLCQDLAQRLRARGQGVLRCICRLDLVRCRPLVMQLGLFRACDDPEHLQSLLVGQLEQALLGLEPQQPTPQSSKKPDARQKPDCDKSQKSRLAASPAADSGDGALAVDDTGAVWRVSLQATLTGPIVWEQTQLFDQSDVRHRQHLARLIDTLSGRLGRGQVLEARIERDAQPEQAVSYRPLTGRRRDGTEQKTVHKLNSRLASSGAEPRPSDPLRRPTHLFAPPEPLAGVSCSVEGLPLEFIFENRRRRVLAHWGPERLESGWWRGPSMRREYYRLETHCGQWWWIFRDLASGIWYVHGLFG